MLGGGNYSALAVTIATSLLNVLFNMSSERLEMSFIQVPAPPLCESSDRVQCDLSDVAPASWMDQGSVLQRTGGACLPVGPHRSSRTPPGEAHTPGPLETRLGGHPVMRQGVPGADSPRPGRTGRV